MLSNDSTLDGRCCNYGKPPHAHVRGRCVLGLHITADATSIERYARSGHPHTLGVFFGKRLRDVFTEVEVDRLMVDGQEVARNKW